MSNFTATVSGGKLVVPSGMKSGDQLTIPAGTYPGLSLVGQPSITVVPGGLVKFTGPLSLDGTTGIDFEGGTAYNFVKAFPGDLVVPGKHIESLTLRGFYGTMGNHLVNVSQNFITYTIGDKTTTALNNCIIDQCKFDGKTDPFYGTWAVPTSLQNVVYGLTITNIVFVNDGTGISGKIFGNSLYNYKLSNWTVTGPTIVNNGDVGVVQIIGWGSIKNIFRQGGFGYMGRLSLCAIDHEGDVAIQNILDEGKVCYGTFDIRVDASTTGALSGGHAVTGCNCSQLNITGGNNAASNGYTTSLLVQYGMSDYSGKKFTSTIDFCFGFNNVHAANQTNIYSQEFTDAAVVGPNCVSLDSADTSKYIDPTTFLPIAGSPLITSAGTIGFLGFGSIVVPNQPPVAAIGTVSTITLPTNTVTLDGTPSSDADGTIAAYAWRFVSGPNSPTLATPTAAKCLVSGLVAGSYVFGLTVTDNKGAVSPTVTTTVVVNPLPIGPAKTIINVQTVTDQNNNILNTSTFTTNL